MKLKIYAFLFCLCFSGFSAYATETITVAVASSLYPAMQQQVEAFEKEHDVTIRLVSGSTGRLYNQIMQGAPFDVFIAADDKRPALLASQGRAISRYNVGQAYLGIKAGKRFLEAKKLTDASIRHIAIANPDVAPFGAATKEVLQTQGLWHVLKYKFVYAQNAMQAAMMVDKALVDAGFVPVSEDDSSIAVLQYVGVLLSDTSLAKIYLESMTGGL
ncbi:MAG: molybdate ABC transporter substrate-binding protein [Mariprofundaceae bacterium]